MKIQLKPIYLFTMTMTINAEVKSAIADVVDIMSEPLEVGSDAYLDKVLHYKERFDSIQIRIAKLSDNLIVA